MCSVLFRSLFNPRIRAGLTTIAFLLTTLKKFYPKKKTLKKSMVLCF